MIMDRGNKKWVSFMIPEHSKLLGKFYQTHNDVSMPVLDEQRVEELNEVLTMAINDQRMVTINYFKANRYDNETGVIKRCDTLNGIVVLKSRGSNYDDNLTIPLRSIIHVEFM